MKIKAVIFDLDNTIISVYSIGNELFKPLFNLIEKRYDYIGNVEDIKKDIMRKPFHRIALEYHFSETLLKDGLEILNSLTADMKMNVFDDYREIRKIPCKKFLVTVGFTKLQQGKIKHLGIEKDFDEIQIVDPEKSDQTKKDVFKDILHRYKLELEDLLVVGDDPTSEIQAAIDLGVKAVLYDKMNFNPQRTDINRITDFCQLMDFL